MNNVGPAKIPGSGLGMVAQQQIEVLPSSLKAMKAG